MHATVLHSGTSLRVDFNRLETPTFYLKNTWFWSGQTVVCVYFLCEPNSIIPFFQLTIIIVKILFSSPSTLFQLEIILMKTGLVTLTLRDTLFKEANVCGFFNQMLVVQANKLKSH